MKLRVVLYVAVAAVALYLFGRWQSAQGRESGAIITQARQSLASGKAYRARQFALQQIARSNMALAREAQRVASIRGALIAKLDTALDRASTVRDSMPIVLRQVVELRGQVSDLLFANLKLERARFGDSTRADEAEGRVAELERNTASLLTVGDCHIAGVRFLPRCPSRTVSLVVGLGIGAVGVLAIHH